MTREEWLRNYDWSEEHGDQYLPAEEFELTPDANAVQHRAPGGDDARLRVNIFSTSTLTPSRLSRPSRECLSPPSKPSDMTAPILVVTVITRRFVDDGLTSSETIFRLNCGRRRSKPTKPGLRRLNIVIGVR
jgi:hypothetical protein